MGKENNQQGSGGKKPERLAGVKALLRAKASGTSRPEVPLPPGALRLYELAQKLQKEQAEQAAGNPAEKPASPEVEQGPERLIGPRNPSHPHVNRDDGSRTPS